MMRQAVIAPAISVFGVEAIVTPAVGDALTLTAIDKTRGAEITDVKTGIYSLSPVVAFAAADLASVDLENLEQGTVEINGAVWTILAVQERPTPFGASDGMVWVTVEAT